MRAETFSSFSDLYRAAFAEGNPVTKQILLAEVKRSLDDWEHSVMATSAKPAAPVSNPSGLQKSA